MLFPQPYMRLFKGLLVLAEHFHSSGRNFLIAMMIGFHYSHIVALWVHLTDLIFFFLPEDPRFHPWRGWISTAITTCFRVVCLLLFDKVCWSHFCSDKIYQSHFILKLPSTTDSIVGSSCTACILELNLTLCSLLGKSDHGFWLLHLPWIGFVHVESWFGTSPMHFYAVVSEAVEKNPHSIVPNSVVSNEISTSFCRL
jgi:hypothetical protein